MKRVLSIWLPNLAIEHWAKSADCAPDAPVVLTIEGSHGPVIHALTKAAAERGARAGARLTDARALDPALIAMAADPQRDLALVQRLARWASRWSPLVERDELDSLRLDVTGVAHLFGGERALVADIEHCFSQIQFTARVAIAPTAAAAWALAHHSPCICGQDELQTRLEPLHVSGLRLEADTVRTLERLGLKTIGALISVPRLALERRFRLEKVLTALDRALGVKADPLTAVASDPPPRALVRLEEPADYPEAASEALKRLIPMLVRELQRRSLGARQLSLSGYRVDGSVAAASVATTIASREPKHLERLLAAKASALDPRFGFDAFALSADWTEDLADAQESLVEEPSGEHELARLIDRLTVKLGASAVRWPQLHESHLPERASGWDCALASLQRAKAATQSGNSTSPSPALTRKRPQRLLDRPEAIDVIYATPEGMPRRFAWRRAVHDIARVEGPERISPEWWRQSSSTRLRDYYRVEDQDGRRYWIYREGLTGDGRGGAPNWFIHGLFG
jgi:protein ImuB